MIEVITTLASNIRDRKGDYLADLDELESIALSFFDEEVSENE